MMIKMSTVNSLALAVSLIAGCYSGPPLPPTVRFDLPPGWEEIQKAPGYVSIGDFSLEGSEVPQHKIETIPKRMFEGDRVSAHQFIDEYYDHLTRPGEEVEEREVLEVSLPSGGVVYANISPGGFGGGEGTIFAFAKDGYVIPMYLNDHIENHIGAVDTIVQSASIITD